MNSDLEIENAHLRKLVEMLKKQLVNALEAVAEKHKADKSQ